MYDESGASREHSDAITEFLEHEVEEDEKEIERLRRQVVRAETLLREAWGVLYKRKEYDMAGRIASHLGGRL